MPVTFPLSSRWRGALSTRGSHPAPRAIAATAVVSAALVLGIPDNATDSAADPLAAGRIADVVPASQNTAEFTAFTPREAQMPQTVPEAVLWEEHRLASEAAAAAKAAAAEAARPHTIRPVAGPLTSFFGSRWGTMHAGLDFGDPLGSPIAAVTDGTVIEAGPASGFGLWVRIQQDDGSIGVYGHMNEILVSVGQHVRAGDVIATVGSRGASTGPHLHYEVHIPGVGAIDPLPWLAARGINVGGSPD